MTRMNPMVIGRPALLSVLHVSTCLLVLMWTSPSGQALQAAPLNDDFTNSVQLTGITVSYEGNPTASTLEPGEPIPAVDNSIWVSWASEQLGYVELQLQTAPVFQYVLVYTGHRVDLLQPVPLQAMVNRVYRFLALEGTVYHFQLSGDPPNAIRLDFHQVAWDAATNDDFADAQQVKGKGLLIPAMSMLDATMELGEPLHKGDQPQKSIWWRWQSPNHGQARLSAMGLAPEITAAIYQGSAVEALTLLAKGSVDIPFQAAGGESYYIAAAVPADAVGDAGFSAQVNPPTGSIHPVPGNLLQKASFEGTAGTDIAPWNASGDFGWYVNTFFGSCDGRTWPVLSTGARLWQEIPTVPGRRYRIRFAHLIGGNSSSCCGLAGVRTLWDGLELGVSYIQETETASRH